MVFSWTQDLGPGGVEHVQGQRRGTWEEGAEPGWGDRQAPTGTRQPLCLGSGCAAEAGETPAQQAPPAHNPGPPSPFPSGRRGGSELPSGFLGGLTFGWDPAKGCWGQLAGEHQAAWVPGHPGSLWVSLLWGKGTPTHPPTLPPGSLAPGGGGLVPSPAQGSKHLQGGVLALGVGL